MKFLKQFNWIVAILLLFTVSCTDDTSDLNGSGRTYTITFETNGGSTIDPVIVAECEAVEKPEDPTKEDYAFSAWYSDSALSSLYDFSTAIIKNTTLYAKWITQEQADKEAAEQFAINDPDAAHPCIWTTNADRDDLLEKIEKYDWAQEVVTKMKSVVDTYVDTHETNPTAFLSTIPTIEANDSVYDDTASSTAHNKILTPAGYAAVLYHITREDKYARFAADVIMYYFDELATRPQSNVTICGEYFYDPRQTYNWISATYDLIYNYLQISDRMVFSYTNAGYVPYNDETAQTAITKIAKNALNMNEDGTYTADSKTYPQNSTSLSKKVTNHPILTAPGSLYPILCITDLDVRDELFEMFWETGTSRQNSYTKSILPMYGDLGNGIWPESTSYSFMPNSPHVLNIIDRVFPDLKIFETNEYCKSLLSGGIFFDNLRNPDRRFVRYGDSKRDIDAVDNNYRIIINICDRNGSAYDEYRNNAIIALNQQYAETARTISIPTNGFENYNVLYDLLWCDDLPATTDEIDFNKTTVEIEHAGIILQRNYVDANNEEYGLCGIIGGANYVHNHASGIAMELYGCGYIMAAGGGLAEDLAGRSEPEHYEYFQHYAGNNTMVINGSSKGTSTNSWSSTKYLYQDDCENYAAEPAHFEDPINPYFNFGTQTLDDSINKCEQQRTLAIVRTSETTGYYFDVFRSKGDTQATRHDYVYHNLGTAATFINGETGTTYSDSNLTTTTLYDNTYDPVNAPGWNHFVASTTKRISGSKTTDAMKVRFDVGSRYMHMLIAGGTERYYTKTTGPATREALSPFDDEPTQIIVVNQSGDAWEDPYFVVFEPTAYSTGSVKSMESIANSAGSIIGAKVTSEVGTKTIVDIIINHAKDTDSYTSTDGDIEFTGHHGIIRTTTESGSATSDVELYIGAGKSLKYKDYSLSTTTTQGCKTQTWSAQTL